jgi:hypothetical protein
VPQEPPAAQEIKELLSGHSYLMPAVPEIVKYLRSGVPEINHFCCSTMQSALVFQTSINSDVPELNHLAGVPDIIQ